MSLGESYLESGVVVSPNPTNGEFSISTLNYSGQLSIEVVDLMGQLIYSTNENLAANSSANIDLTDAANGVYIVNVSNMTETRSMRVIKK